MTMELGTVSHRSSMLTILTNSALESFTLCDCCSIDSIAVLKEGKHAEEGQEQVDAWAGATITSTGVNDMLANSLNAYADFLEQVPAAGVEELLNDDEQEE